MSVPVKRINAADFIHMLTDCPVIDVRSPSEFRRGHIPGALNIPLFDDKERESVGIIYKHEGSIAAVLKGFELAGPCAANKLKRALNVAAKGKLLVYCWRGGMRSETMAWLFSTGNIETVVLEGGYKAYRNYILEYISRKRKYIILGGLTGSGKTDILRYIEKLRHQVVDLEGLACHKGSAFGSLGQPAQPTSEHFANILFESLSSVNDEKPVWLEDESKNIGSVFIPDEFYSCMQNAPVIALLMDIKTRMPRLLKEYSSYPEEELIKSVLKISRRLGGERTRECIESVKSGNFEKAVEITLDYYDKSYLYGLRRRVPNNIMYIETATDNVHSNALRILEIATEIPDIL